MYIRDGEKAKLTAITFDNNGKVSARSELDNSNDLFETLNFSPIDAFDDIARFDPRALRRAIWHDFADISGRVGLTNKNEHAGK